MLKRLAFVLVFLMLGCNTEVPTSPTPGPTDMPSDPTPTQQVVTPTPDTSWWDKSCIDELDGVLISDNPCMSGRLAEMGYGFTQEKPVGFSVVFNPVRNQPIQGTYIWYENDFFNIDATFYHGEVGYAVQANNPGLACHKVIVNVKSTINILPSANPANSALNFAITVKAIADGEEYVIGQTAVAQEWRDGFDQPHWNFSWEPRSFEFPFYFAEGHDDVQIQVLFSSIWDLGNHGSTFGFSKVGVFRQTSFESCDGRLGL